MKPTVGRIVHYHSHAGDDPLAAIITRAERIYDSRGELMEEEEYEVLLRVFPSSAAPLLALATTPFAETSTPGHWSWPPRE